MCRYCKDVAELLRLWLSTETAGCIGGGYGKLNLTPYFHILVAHVPYMLAALSAGLSLHAFVGEGLEACKLPSHLTHADVSGCKFARDTALHRSTRKDVTVDVLIVDKMLRKLPAPPPARYVSLCATHADLAQAVQHEPRVCRCSGRCPSCARARAPAPSSWSQTVLHIATLLTCAALVRASACNSPAPLSHPHQHSE